MVKGGLKTAVVQATFSKVPTNDIAMTGQMLAR
jgi:hypothetical protein